jgi:acetyl esterase/lipase
MTRAARQVGALAGLLLAVAATAQSPGGSPGSSGSSGSAAAAASAGASTIAFSLFEAPTGERLDVEWHLPAAEPRALLTLQHGYTRRCANLRHTASGLAAAGFATLCLNADMAHGAPALAAALGQALAGAAFGLPDGRALPSRVLVAGHSAGGLFAAHLGAELQRRVPERLAGALLFDPVGGAALAEALGTVSAGGLRPVRALLAPPSRCNANQRARQALTQVADAARAAGHDPFVGLELRAATHLDAEGEDTEAVAVWACREGPPQAQAVALLRALAAGWAQQMVAGAPDAQTPTAQALIESGRATPLAP